MDPNAAESRNEIAYTWDIANVQQTKIDLQFIFEEPLTIVPADTLKIDLKFNEFDKGFLDEELIVSFMSKQLPIGGAGNIEQMATAVT